VARDPYSVLGVAKTASEAEIKSAFRKLAKRFHPDQNKDNASAVEAFKEINAAYDIVGDVEKRAKYDRGEIGADGAARGYEGFGGGGYRGRPGSAGGAFTGDPMDLFEELFGGAKGQGGPSGGYSGGFGGGFGGRAQGPLPKGRTITLGLLVPFEAAAKGEAQRVTLPNGKTIDLKLPAGFVDGQQVRLAGQGEAGPGGPGDALVTLTLQPHAFFKRDGDDVLLDLPLRLDEAVHGAKVKVPTVTGAVMLTIPAGARTGQVMRLRGKGFARAGGGHGDQRVRLLLDLPTDDPDLKAFADTWKAGKASSPRTNFGLD
jgi:DnaJ-class molecular chaperone